MFAKSSSNENYHLLQPGDEETLCGQPVAPIIIDRPVKVSALHLTKIRPIGRALCEVCARASSKQEDSQPLRYQSAEG